MTTAWTLTARWILPIASPPVANGVLTVDGETIVAVEPRGTRSADFDLGDVAVLPSLVNAHVHLDLSGMRGVAPPRLPLPDWLSQVIAHRRTRSPEQIDADVAAGLAECLRTGTTLVGDVSGDGGSWHRLAKAPIRAVVFRELLGLTRERADAAVRLAEEWLDQHSATTTCRPGLSPHAPYSVHTTLLGHAAVLSRLRRAPLAIHLAESIEELQLLHQRRGPFVDFLKSLGVWEPEGLPRGISDVMKVCDTHNKRLFVHGNYLAPSARIPRGSTIVYCPRTHAAFGHPLHPFRAFLKRGIRVALGTDGLSSNPDLDLLAEARFLYRHVELPGETIVRMATLAGAEALDFDSVTGSLTPGKSADLIVVPLTVDQADPYDAVLASDLPVSRVMSRGRWLASDL